MGGTSLPHRGLGPFQPNITKINSSLPTPIDEAPERGRGNPYTALPRMLKVLVPPRTTKLVLSTQN